LDEREVIESTGSLDLARARAIRLWLYAVAALVLAMVLVGGATRLTESGLSITEWKPLMGVVPPLSENAWQSAFEKYQAIPQYRELNSGMSLAEFKTIYWWEWTHRLLGRVIGVAYLLPFLWFLWRGWVAQDLRPRLWFIFGLGALQGVVGWWMVASGLADRVEVSQYRLATHLLLACAIYVALIWTAWRLTDRTVVPVPGRIRLGAVGLLILVLAQVYLGAVVAGLRAGYAYNTWPLIDGSVVPETARLFFETPAVAQFLREYSDGAVRSPRARLRDLCRRACAYVRCRAHGERTTGAVGCGRAVRRYRAASGARHRDAAVARASAARFSASGCGDAGPDRRDHARGGPRRALAAGGCRIGAELEHDPEKWKPVFRKDHAPPKS
jgi:heme A synthase